MSDIKLYHGDVRAWEYEGPLCHAMLCDLPYELGFMGKHWDKSGVAFQPETWARLAGFLHPGAFVMAFGGSRTFHRLVCALEDAGLIIHPTMCWLYGSGFPKATRIDTQIDKATRIDTQIDKAARWGGHRYGLQALKPAAEFIVVAQKPYQRKPVECITETGAGALWIDGGRIGTKDKIPIFERYGGKSNGIYSDGLNNGSRTSECSLLGRWPANLILDEEAARVLGEQSGEGGNGHKSFSIHRDRPPSRCKGAEHAHVTLTNFGDTGTAARFFYQVDYQLEQADPFLYCAKAARSERDAGLDSMGLKPCGMMEDDNYPIKTGSGNLRETMRRNHHPTVKPIKLTQYLATLLLPPAEYAPRRMLVPFAGSGSEMIGAGLAGWEEVVGCELLAENVEIARARLGYWLRQEKMAI